MRVSAAKRTGLDELQAALDAALDRAPERPDLGHARLPIDRAFTMTGFGTVVTGTLSGGSVAVGDELRIRPGGRRVRVRGLQSHRTQVSTAPPGRRVAVNLSGVSVGQAPRGSVLASDGAVVDSRRVDATFRLLPNAPRAIKPGERVAWHSGTAEVVASARYLQTEPIEPGATGWVQWRLSEPVALAKGDPYVVRRLSPPLTIGGGEIVRTTTRRLRRGDSDEIDRLEIAATAGPEEIVLAAVEAHGPLRAAELARRTDLGAAMVAAVAQPALAEGRLASAGGWLWSMAGLAEARARVRAAVEARHADTPTAAGLDRAELRALVDIATDPLTALLDDMALDGTIVLRGTRVALAGHRVELSAEQEAAAQRLLVELDAGGTTPPGLAEARARGGRLQHRRGGAGRTGPSGANGPRHRDLAGDVRRLARPLARAVRDERSGSCGRRARRLSDQPQVRAGVPGASRRPGDHAPRGRRTGYCSGARHDRRRVSVPV